MEKEFDRLSYALGMSMGNNFKGTGIEKINAAYFAAGVAAVYDGAKPLMTYDEAKKVINAFFASLQEKQQKEASRMAEVNAAAGADFLKKNAERPEVKTTASGLQYEVVVAGKGSHPKATDSVTVHYTGRLIDGTVFDSSIERGEPATFGVGQVIPGWVEALQMMVPGDKWRIYIPGNLAYGPQGAGGVIGPNSTLIFDVELISIN